MILSEVIRYEKGIITRKEALKMIEIENIPRIERIKEYLDLIGLDYDFVMCELEKIKENSFQKLELE